jgi:hypothetical protein
MPAAWIEQPEREYVVNAISDPVPGTYPVRRFCEQCVSHQIVLLAEC